MWELIAGVICLILGSVLPMPYFLHVILLIAGILLVAYGIFLLLTRRRRFYVRRR